MSKKKSHSIRSPGATRTDKLWEAADSLDSERLMSLPKLLKQLKNADLLRKIWDQGQS